MNIFIVIILLAASSGMLSLTFRRLWQRHVGGAWWLAFGCLSAVGVALGYWLTIHFEYQVSPKMRFVGFPIPLSFFHLEDGQWVDFPTPPSVMYPGLLANVVAVTAVATLPILVISFLINRPGINASGAT